MAAPIISITYILTVTGLNGCSIFDTIPIVVHQPLTANAGLDTTICEGDTIVLNGSGGPQCSWDPGTGLSDPNACDPLAFPSDTTEYILTVFDDSSACPPVFDTMTINAQHLDSASITILTIDNPICVGDTAKFTATPTNGGSDPSYQWKVNGTNVGIDTTIYVRNTLADGDVVVCDLYSNVSCVAQSPVSSNEITMTVNPLPTVNITGLENQYCNTSPAVTLTGSPPGGVFSGPGVSANKFSPAIAGVGIHSIIYTFTDGNGCTDSASQQVTVNECDGIGEINGLNSVSIHPNPNWGTFSVEGQFKDALDLRIAVMNLLGKRLLVKEWDHIKDRFQVTIDIGSEPAGIFFLEIRSAKQNSTRKIIKY